MGIPFHADVFGNVVYCSSKAIVIAMESIFYMSGEIRVVGRFSDCWYLLRAFRGRWDEDRGIGWWQY